MEHSQRYSLVVATVPAPDLQKSINRSGKQSWQQLKKKMQVTVVSVLLVFLVAMLWSQQVEGHWNFTTDLRGRDGRDGKDGSPGRDGRDGRDGEKGKSDQKETWGPGEGGEIQDP